MCIYLCPSAYLRIYVSISEAFACALSAESSGFARALCRAVSRARALGSVSQICEGIVFAGRRLKTEKQKEKESLV